MFKAYNVKKSKWVFNVLTNAYGELYQKKGIFLKKLNDSDMSIYMDTGCHDKDNDLIFESDIIQDADGKCGIVFYASEIASFLFFDYKGGKAYALGKELYENAKIIGNVIDNHDLVKEYFDSMQDNSDLETESKKGDDDEKDEKREDEVS